MKILVLNGPNLNLLGRREPSVYGSCSFDDYLPRLREAFPGVEIDYFQSNVEACSSTKCRKRASRMTHSAQRRRIHAHQRGLHDCIRAITCPVVEVHISNVHRREDFRHKSMLSAACLGVICGFGLDSYRLAVSAILIHNS